MTERCYAVVFETKMEQPIVCESRPLTYDEALDRARRIAGGHNVIRVAVVKMIYAGWGHETLVDQEKDN